MAWFKKERKPLVSSAEPSRVPEGLWVKCPSCNQILYEKDLIKNMRVCNSCSYHFRMNAVQRLSSLFDDINYPTKMLENERLDANCV